VFSINKGFEENQMPANEDCIDLEGWDLGLAAQENRPAIARALIARGDDIQVRDEDGDSPLHLAVWKDSLDVIRLLIKNDADIDARNDAGDTPLVYAYADGDCVSPDIAHLLIEHGANTDSLLEDYWDFNLAATDDRADIAHALIARGDDINARDESGYPPLYLAAWENALDVARLLIEKGAYLEASDKYGNTPLARAVWKNSLGVARLLIEKGADLEAKDDYGNTPLSRSCEDSVDVARLLIEKGANIDGIDLSWMN
jgi:ankyrin repeat protein